MLLGVNVVLVARLKYLVSILLTPVPTRKFMLASLFICRIFLITMCYEQNVILLYATIDIHSSILFNTFLSLVNPVFIASHKHRLARFCFLSTEL